MTLFTGQSQNRLLDIHVPYPIGIRQSASFKPGNVYRTPSQVRVLSYPSRLKLMLGAANRASHMLAISSSIYSPKVWFSKLLHRLIQHSTPVDTHQCRRRPREVSFMTFEVLRTFTKEPGVRFKRRRLPRRSLPQYGAAS